ncbi:MAG TPA: PglZ domain-containing protein [Flavobacteriaceae bacterium]|nr:PglZ domain-containing protein [Flavobacteriaceae bacterium]
MAKGIIQHIARDLKEYGAKVILIRNSDRFLYREDVIHTIKTYGIHVVHGSKISQRIAFELKDPEDILILLSQNNSDYLEDIIVKSIAIDFELSSYYSGYHIPSIKDVNLKILDVLLDKDQIVSLNRRRTLEVIEKIKEAALPEKETQMDIPAFIKTLNTQLDNAIIDWAKVCKTISKGVIKAIKTSQVEELILEMSEVNNAFQKNIESTYQQTKNSSAVKKPKIVSKVLDYLSFNYLNEKIALIVIDGLAYWQYDILKEKLPLAETEDVIYSWLPSITQLSRQAIFRGDTPKKEYYQGPVSEERLWRNYWIENGNNEFEIRYNHEKIDLSNLDRITKFAIVFKDLDDKMHSSTDYKDLLALTENWIERSDIANIVRTLKEEGFTIFITTDHGNIQAKGWRGLKGREKLGTHKSGSRSTRHLEYSTEWLFEEFLENNPELIDSIVTESQSIYLNDNLSFSREESLVTHGGAHILEVLIPFIKI